MQVTETVQSRYAEGAKEKQEALCCPVGYQMELLEILPKEIIDKDYGCGDPSRYVRPGDVVLDLGSGGGKICYMAAQLVGQGGQVIGVDMTDDMLSLARKYKGEMADKLGEDRVEFKKGFIQDLALDVEALDAYIRRSPISDLEALSQLESWKSEQRASRPLISDQSVDIVISNCVLNLVGASDRAQMLSEIFRVLKPGGRVAISDIVSDESVPEHLQQDGELWSGCISGAFQEEAFLEAFLDAGFVGVAYDKWDTDAWRVVEGIEFRSVTLMAVKPAKSGLIDAGHAVLYRGPFRYVEDDLGNHYPRGKRIAVSKRTYELLMDTPYSEHFIGFSPSQEVNNGCFSKPAGSLRKASETKGGEVSGVAGSDVNSCC